MFETIQAQDGPVLTFNVPTQNMLQFNRYLINPAFSVVKENASHLTLYHRNQWIEFNDSPELYMLTYSGRVGERSGAGIGLYQQNLGIITSFGGVANYAYQIPLKENISLAVGFNLAYYTTGVNRNKSVSNEPDPAILELANNSLLTLKPGINVTWGSFDVGVYAENLVDYDFKSSGLVEEYSNKTFSGHAMYHHQMNNQSGLFEDGYFRLMMLGKINEIEDFGIGGSLLVNFPYLGWVQTGLDDYYGISFGLGGHLTNKLSLGYTYERVINDGAVNFGPTHEITLSFRFPSKSTNQTTRTFDNTKKSIETVKVEVEEEEYIEEEEVIVIPKEKTAKQGVNQDIKPDNKDAEIEKLRMTLDEKNIKFLDMIVKDDSIAKLKKEDYEKRIVNMMAYIQRLENTAQKKEECNCEETIETTVITETTTTVRKNEKNAATEGSKKDISTILAETESASDINVVKINNKTITSNKENKNDINAKLSALKPNTNNNNQSKTKFTLTDEEIKNYYSKLTTKQRTTAKRNYLEVANQDPGYYIMANVFSDTALADNFMIQLKKLGIKAYYFDNPKNKFRYVYLRKHDNWSDALISYYTNVDNSYFDTIWIMNININKPQ
jgi:type IX secretion system PorP/SprF family membrane protein